MSRAIHDTGEISEDAIKRAWPLLVTRTVPAFDMVDLTNYVNTTMFVPPVVGVTLPVPNVVLNPKGE